MVSPVLAVLVAVSTSFLVPMLGVAQTLGMSQKENRAALSRVATWGCQYQNIVVEELAASDLDLVVINHTIDGRTGASATPREVARLQTKPGGGRRLVLAYLSVGEAESYRRYWQPDWSKDPPSWLGPKNPVWPGAYAVRFWDRHWQSLLFYDEHALLTQILMAGFDGVLLDRVDAYMDWERVHPAAQAEMIELVARLAEKARANRSGFIILAQNAEPLLLDSRYIAAIDGVTKESLLYGLKGRGLENDAADVDWSLSKLLKIKSAGLPVFAIEYLDSPTLAASARQQLRVFGFIPFIANRVLDRLPGSVP